MKYEYAVIPLVFVLAMAVVAVAQSQTDVSVTPTTVNELNKKFTVPITIDTTEDIYGFEITATYDSDYVDFEGIEEGGFLSSDGAWIFCFDQTTSNEITLVCTRFFVQNGVTGQGTLGEITFTSKQNGSFHSDLDGILVNADVEEVEADYTGADIVIDAQ